MVNEGTNRFISQRSHKLLDSPTLALDAKVQELRRGGRQILNLTIGEPDFDTPDNIRESAVEAISSGFTHYTAASGILELKQAICGKLDKENGLNYAPPEIVVGPGTKYLLYEAFQVLLNKGDEVILSIPTWSTYVEQIKLAQGKSALIKLKPPFKLSAAQIESKITKRTKVILLNSPANPTGSLIDPSELKKIVTLAKRYDLFIISDEIYEKIIYGDVSFISTAAIDERAKDRILTINGFSKAYAMTGWRLGYAAGPMEIIAKMSALQSQTTSNPTSISQKAGVQALLGPQKSIKTMTREFRTRRSLLVRELGKIPNLSFTSPEGAFYLFISVESMFSEKTPTSLAWAEAILEEEGVAVVPGEAFLYPGYVRLSYATSEQTLSEAVKRIRRFCKRHA